MLFKPVRATALLAYHDHPSIRAILVGEPEAAHLPSSRLVRAKAAERTASEPSGAGDAS